MVEADVLIIWELSIVDHGPQVVENFCINHMRWDLDLDYCFQCLCVYRNVDALHVACPRCKNLALSFSCASGL